MSCEQAASLVRQLRQSIHDERVLAAIAALPRERFVPGSQQASAYDNVALPIGAGQTISQPLVVARMLVLLDLRPGDRVLDVGTGSGYHAALLAQLAGHVWTIERHAELSLRAQTVMRELGIDNVTFAVGDGSHGLPSLAPFDAINVAAGAREPPPALVAQLSVGGRLVVPVGARQQHLVVIRRDRSGLSEERHEAVRFVPLIPGGSARPEPAPREPDAPA